MKSIKTKMLVLMEIILLVVIIGLSTLSLRLSSSAIMNVTDKTMQTIAEEGTKIVQSRVSEQLSIIEAISIRHSITDSSIPVEQKLASLADDVKKYNYMSMAIADLNGNTKYTDSKSANISDRPFYQKALKGELAVSDPLVSKTNGAIVVVYAAPIIENGKIIGVLVAGKNGNDISSISNDITFGTTGKSFMISSNGTKIAHYDKNLVTKMDNDLVNVKKDPGLKSVVELEKKMINGEKGSGTYSYNGKEKYLSFAPVPKTSWSLGVVVEQSELMSEVNLLRKTIIIAAALFLFLAFVIVYFISNSIAKRINLATNYVVTMASGDFTDMISNDHLDMKDEIGTMIQAINTMQASIKKMLQSVVDNSKKIDEDSKNLSVVSEQMSSSSESVALAVQEVTKGASSQAEDLVKITESLNGFGDNLERITNNIKDVDVNSKKIISLAGESNSQIQNLSSSLVDITNTFKNFEVKIIHSGENIGKINEITSLINSISEQTNLLALNAAIEAARAGEAGRGFSVVADEIRKLAEQSQGSVANISELIRNIYEENETMITTSKLVSEDFNKQTVVIEDTLGSFNTIIKAVNEVIPGIESINYAVSEINSQKNEIIHKVESTAAIAEETSAASEEIAASSEEMSSSSEEVSVAAKNLELRASEMMKQVNQFKISNE